VAVAVEGSLAAACLGAAKATNVLKVTYPVSRLKLNPTAYYHPANPIAWMAHSTAASEVRTVIVLATRGQVPIIGVYHDHIGDLRGTRRRTSHIWRPRSLAAARLMPFPMALKAPCYVQAVCRHMAFMETVEAHTPEIYRDQPPMHRRQWMSYPVFMPKPSTHCMHDLGTIVPHIRPKVITDNQIS
jgi:hypothetical protein